MNMRRCLLATPAAARRRVEAFVGTEGVAVPAELDASPRVNRPESWTDFAEVR